MLIKLVVAVVTVAMVSTPVAYSFFFDPSIVFGTISSWLERWGGMLLTPILIIIVAVIGYFGKRYEERQLLRVDREWDH